MCLGTVTCAGGENSASKGTITTLVPQENSPCSPCGSTETLPTITCGCGSLLVADLLKQRVFIAWGDIFWMFIQLWEEWVAISSSNPYMLFFPSFPFFSWKVINSFKPQLIEEFRLEETIEEIVFHSSISEILYSLPRSHLHPSTLQKRRLMSLLLYKSIYNFAFIKCPPSLQWKMVYS